MRMRVEMCSFSSDTGGGLRDEKHITVVASCARRGYNECDDAGYFAEIAKVIPGVCVHACETSGKARREGGSVGALEGGTGGGERKGGRDKRRG